MFLDEVMAAYRKSRAHSFLLHGAGVEDCVTPGVMLGAYLRKALLKGKTDIVLFYDCATGFSFPDDLAAAIHKEKLAAGEDVPAEYVPMKTRAARALGLTAQVGARPASSPLAKAAAAAEPEFPVAPAEALPIIDRLLRATVTDDKGRAVPLKCTVVFEYAQVVFPRTSQPQPDLETLAIFPSKWATEAAWTNGAFAPLILYIARDKAALHGALTDEGSRVFAVELPSPDFDERLRFAQSCLAGYSGVTLADDLDERLLATHTAGLSRLGIEDIIVSCQVDKKPVSLSAVQDRKRGLMDSAYGGVLATDAPRFGFDSVAGHDEVKAFCLRNIVEPLRSGNVRRVPKGIIFAGPPGTGKTLLAEALAWEAGVGHARLELQALMNKFVGESERNLRRALDAIRSLFPCIVFIDELDTAFATRDGADSGQVNKNLLGMILTFLSDPALKGRVVFVAATNRPDKVDPALRRPGRFDKLVPILAPGAETRVKLLRLVGANLGCAWAEDVDFEDAARLTDGWTQAELDALVQAVYQEADDAGHGDTLTGDDLQAALAYVRPSTAAVEAWSGLAVSMCNDYRLLPAEWRQRAEDNALPEPPALAQSTTRGVRDW